MTKEETEAILGKLSDEAKAIIKTHSEDLQKKFDEKYKGLTTGAVTKEQMDDLRKDVEDANKKMNEALEKQGTKMGELTKSIHSAPVDPWAAFKADFEKESKSLKELIENKTGVKQFTLKAAGITATIGLGGNSASILEGGSAAALLRLGDGEVYSQNRGTPFILNFVNVGNTTAAALVWYDEQDKQGDFAITAEGSTKPLVQYIFTRKTAEYKKAAGRTRMTEEFMNDFPRLVSTIKSLMVVDLNNDMNAQILTDMIAAAAPYAYSGLDNQVDNADDYAAIGAALAQVQSLYFNPNVLVINVADAWRMRLQKDTQGRYIVPPFTWNGTTYEFGQVIVDPRVPIGNFFVGDGSVFHVDLKGDVIIRIGYGTGDFEANELTIIVERYFYDYISSARRGGLVYGNYDVIKADIEKV